MSGPSRSTSGNDQPSLTDSHGRTIDHLRLSLIDHCNLACRYCIAENNATPSPQRIEADFAFALVKWLSERHGVDHIRLTGGEPLLYADLITLIERLAKLPTLEEITLTTNAQALAAKARDLREAGLSRVNISLDTLNPDTFARITRGGKVERTLRGIEAARDAGLLPLRINVVVQRGVNENELPDIAAWGISRGCVVRFLEVMPIGPLAHLNDRHLVSAAEILERLSARFELRQISSPHGQPATDYAARASDCHGVIGVIGSTTRPFCSSCQRIRITSRGQLLNCLFESEGVSLKSAWNGRSLDVDGADILLQTAVAGKRATGLCRQNKPMIQIGG